MPTAESMNLVVLQGRLTAPVTADTRAGRRLGRLTLAVRAGASPRRIDAVPVRLWEPSDDLLATPVGSTLLVVGSLHRRFWASSEGRQSRLDVVAERVEASTSGMDEPGPGASLPRPCP